MNWKWIYNKLADAGNECKLEDDDEYWSEGSMSNWEQLEHFLHNNELTMNEYWANSWPVLLTK